jgi:hypothetical protein
MGFAQLTSRDSLCDIKECLNAEDEAALCHLGLRKPVAPVTLAEANEQRDWRLRQDLATRLIKLARRLYGSEALTLDLGETIYTLKPTATDSSLQIFRGPSSARPKLAANWTRSSIYGVRFRCRSKRAQQDTLLFEPGCSPARPRLHGIHDWPRSPAQARSSSPEPKTTCASRPLAPARGTSEAA